MVQPYFHLKTCCIVNNNKDIPDKAVNTNLITLVTNQVIFKNNYVVFGTWSILSKTKLILLETKGSNLIAYFFPTDGRT